MRLAAWAASLALFMAAGPACAQVATGGVGAHRSSILWFDWGTAPANIPNAGTSVTNTLTMAGQSLSVTCTLNAISGSGTDPDLRIYRPGTYFEDSLDNLYNVGGTGTANAMDIGVMNRASGSDAALTYACSATLGGQPYALEGLVFADAQSTNINESTQVTVPAGATVRAFERHRAAGCNVPYMADVAGNTYRFSTLYPHTCFGAGDSSNAMGVFFIGNATTASVYMDGTGEQAIALGVLVSAADYGDAPASYGVAGHLVRRTWSGGTLPSGSTDIFGGSFARASLNLPADARLGAEVDTESSAWTSSTALGDDQDAADDEDSIGTLAPLFTATGGMSYSVAVSCAGTASVAGWIDFDRSGAFDSDERSATATCAAGTANLTWTRTADIAAGSAYLRVRTALSAAEIANATGLASTGEVEDHPLTIQASAPRFATCDARLFHVSGADSGPAAFRSISIGAAPLVPSSIGSTGIGYNGMGYNSADNFIYAVGPTLPLASQKDLLRIGSDGVAVSLGPITGLPASRRWAAGEVAGGVLYVASTTAGDGLYAINLNTRVATPVSLPATTFGADLAWSNGRLYTMVGAGATTILRAIDPVAGTVADIGASPASAGAFEALYGTPYGLYGASSGGGFYAIDRSTGAITLVGAMTAPATNADGAHCANAEIAFATDLSVSITDGKTRYAPGTNNVYTLVVANPGAFGAQNVTVSHPLPAGITTASWTCVGAGGGTCRASGTGAINDATVDLPPGATATYTLTLSIPAGFSGTLTSTVTITPPDDIDDGNSANNTATDVDQRSPLLTLVKTVTNDNGGTQPATAWTLSASGPTPISGATGTAAVTEAAVIPGHYTLSESSTPTGYVAGSYSCVKNGAAAVAGNSVSLVDDDSAICTIHNNDSNEADVSVVMTGNAATRTPGDAVTFTLQVSNAGPARADGARIYDPAVAGLDCATVSCSTAGGGSCPGTSTVAGLQAAPGLTIPALPAGGSVTFLLTCTVTANGFP